MGDKSRASMWCPTCQRLVAGQKATHRARSLTGLFAIPLTGGLSSAAIKSEGWHCPNCGQPVVDAKVVNGQVYARGLPDVSAQPSPELRAADAERMGAAARREATTNTASSRAQRRMKKNREKRQRKTSNARVVKAADLRTTPDPAAQARRQAAAQKVRDAGRPPRQADYPDRASYLDAYERHLASRKEHAEAEVAAEVARTAAQARSADSSRRRRDLQELVDERKSGSISAEEFAAEKARLMESPSTEGVAAGSPPKPSEHQDGSLVTDLERLAELHRSGALSESEYAAAKARLLGTS